MPQCDEIGNDTKLTRPITTQNVSILCIICTINCRKRVQKMQFFQTDNCISFYRHQSFEDLKR